MSGTEDVTVLETADGVAIVDTFEINATVTAIDAEKRKVTLTTADGSHKTVPCGPEVVSFDLPAASWGSWIVEAPASACARRSEGCLDAKNLR